MDEGGGALPHSHPCMQGGIILRGGSSPAQGSTVQRGGAWAASLAKEYPPLIQEHSITAYALQRAFVGRCKAARHAEHQRALQAIVSTDGG